MLKRSNIGGKIAHGQLGLGTTSHRQSTCALLKTCAVWSFLETHFRSVWDVFSFVYLVLSLSIIKGDIYCKFTSSQQCWEIIHSFALKGIKKLLLNKKKYQLWCEESIFKKQFLECMFITFWDCLTLITTHHGDIEIGVS